MWHGLNAWFCLVVSRTLSFVMSSIVYSSSSSSSSNSNSSSNCSYHTPSSHCTPALWTAFSLSISFHYFLFPLSSSARWLFFVPPLYLSLPRSLSLSPPPECGWGLIRKCMAQNTQSITLPKPFTPAHALADTYTQTHTYASSPSPLPPFYRYTQAFLFLFQETIIIISYLPLFSTLYYSLSFKPCPSSLPPFLTLSFHSPVSSTSTNASIRVMPTKGGGDDSSNGWGELGSFSFHIIIINILITLYFIERQWQTWWRCFIGTFTWTFTWISAGVRWSNKNTKA